MLLINTLVGAYLPMDNTKAGSFLELSKHRLNEIDKPVSTNWQECHILEC